MTCTLAALPALPLAPPSAPCLHPCSSRTQRGGRTSMCAACCWTSARRSLSPGPWCVRCVVVVRGGRGCAREEGAPPVACPVQGLRHTCY